MGIAQNRRRSGAVGTHLGFIRHQFLVRFEISMVMLLLLSTSAAMASADSVMLEWLLSVATEVIYPSMNKLTTYGYTCLASRRHTNNKGASC